MDRARRHVRGIAALAALILALGTASANAQDETYESLEGGWWFSLGGRDAGALLIQLSESSSTVFAIEDIELTGSSSFGFSRALGAFFRVVSGQELTLDSQGHFTGTLELTDPDSGLSIGELSFERGKPSDSRARLRSNGSLTPDGMPGLRVKLVGRRTPESFAALSGHGDGARLGGQSVSSRVYDLEVRTHSELGVPAYAFTGAGPAQVDRLEVESVPLAGEFMLAPGGRVYGRADDTSYFGTGGLTGRLRVPTGGAVPKVELTIEADRRVRTKGYLDDPVEPILSVDPGSFDFGAVTLTEAPPTQVFRVENIGLGSLTGEARIANGSSAAFALLGPTGYADLEPGDEPFDVLVQFAPAALGAHTGELLLSVNGGAGAIRVALSGVGGAPVLSVEPDSYDFGDVVVGESDTFSFAISNLGDAVLSGAATLSGSDDYELLPADDDTSATSIAYTIEIGQTESVRVRFTPTATGSRAGTLLLTGGDGASVPLTGNGTPAP